MKEKYLFVKLWDDTLYINSLIALQTNNKHKMYLFLMYHGSAGNNTRNKYIIHAAQCLQWLRNAFYYDVLLLSAKGNKKARFNIALRTRGWGNAGGK